MDKIPVSRKIISNLFYYFLDLSSITILGYVFWILMGKFLVPEQYGILQTVISLFSILAALTTLGFNEALIKFVPELFKQGKRDEAYSMIRFSIKVVSFFALFVSIFVFLFSDSISFFVYGSSKLVLPLRFLSVILFSGTIFNLFKFILQGLQEYRKLFLYDLIGNISRIIVAVLLLYLGFQASSGILGWSSWYIVFIILSLAVIKLKSTASFNRRTFYHFAYLSVLSITSLLVLSQGNIVILSLLSNFEAVGFFGVAVLFGQIILFVPNVIIGSIFPNISELWIENKDHIKHLISASIKFTSVIVIPLLILFTILSEFLIKVFYTESYVLASKVFPLVLSGSFLFGLGGILSITLYSIYKPKVRVAILVFGAIVNVLLSFMLISYYNLTGAALAYLLSQTLVLFAMLYFTNKSLNFEFSKRSLNILPSVLVFALVLYFSLQLSNVLVKGTLVLLDIAIYVILITKLHVLNKNDLFILEFFPNRFGFGFLKKIARKLIS